MLPIRIAEATSECLSEYSTIPIAFEVRGILECASDGLRGIRLSELDVAVPYTKDYDSIEGNGPKGWPERFDIQKWTFLLATSGGDLVGGAALAFRSAGVELLEGEGDAVVLWDLRVRPESRRSGIGSALLDAAEGWARDRDYGRMMVETQNVNLPACEFYSQNGFELGAIHRFAYPSFPDEVQLVWYKDLALQ